MIRRRIRSEEIRHGALSSTSLLQSMDFWLSYVNTNVNVLPTSNLVQVEVLVMDLIHITGLTDGFFVVGLTVGFRVGGLPDGVALLQVEGLFLLNRQTLESIHFE